MKSFAQLSIIALVAIAGLYVLVTGMHAAKSIAHRNEYAIDQLYVNQ